MLSAASEEYQKAKDLVASEKTEEAIPILQALVRKEPANWRAFGCLGVALAKQHREAEALDALRRAVQLQPRNASLRYNLGQVYQLAGNHLEALHSFEAALRADPQYHLARQAYERLRAYLQDKSA